MEKNPPVNSKIALIVICIVQFITPFLAAGVNVALPAIGKYYQATTFQLSLASMMYLLGLGCLLLPSGQLADLYGRKNIFFKGIVLFLITTAVITFSPNIEIFLALRLLQGMGTALITTASFAILSSIVPPERRGRAMGIIIAFVYAGLSAGPALSGLLVKYMSWQAIFWFSSVASLLGMVLSYYSLRGSEWWGERNRTLDITGSALFALTLTCLTISVTGREWVGNWSSALLLLTCAGAVIFVLFETKTNSPVFPVTFFLQNGPFSLSIVAALLNYAASFGIIFFFSLYLQSIKGLSPEHAGLLLMIQTLVQCLLSPGAGKLADRIYPGKLATLGMGLCAISLFMAGQIDAHSSISLIVSIFLVMGLGFALFSTPNTTLIMNSVPKELYGMASSLTAIARSLGMLTSMGISTYLIEHFMGHTSITTETQQAFMSSMHWGMIVFATISCIGIFCSIGRIHKKDESRCS
ncbi:MFS transporter [Desulfogranum japonicum]|uniref:MFS transporter n=1 Tax=Desulfogranum japonicum TaxID=231447 RepID=UPI00049139C8|nr:MFS transporter [Desulfogranum japonicum]